MLEKDDSFLSQEPKLSDMNVQHGRIGFSKSETGEVIMKIVALKGQIAIDGLKITPGLPQNVNEESVVTFYKADSEEELAVGSFKVVAAAEKKGKKKGKKKVVFTLQE